MDLEKTYVRVDRKTLLDVSRIYGIGEHLLEGSRHSLRMPAPVYE